MFAKTHLGDCGSQVSIHIAFSPDGRYIKDFVMLIFIGLNVPPPPCTHTETFLLAVVMLLVYGKHYKELENLYSSMILVNNKNNDSR